VNGDDIRRRKELSAYHCHCARSKKKLSKAENDTATWASFNAFRRRGMINLGFIEHRDASITLSRARVCWRPGCGGYQQRASGRLA